MSKYTLFWESPIGTLTLEEEERKGLKEAGSDGEFSKAEFRELAVCVDQLLESRFDMDVSL